MALWAQIANEIMNYNAIYLIFIIGTIFLAGIIIVKKIMIKGINGFIAVCDPLVISLILSELSAAVVPIYMYINGWFYDDKMFYSYFLSEIALFFGIFVATGLANKNIIIDEKKDTSIVIKKRFYIATTFVYFVLKIIYFAKVGIPIFSDKYYTLLMAEETFLSRIIICFYLMVCMLWIDSLTYIKAKINYLVGALIVASFIFSAQKGLIAYFLFAMFFHQLFRLKKGKSIINLSPLKIFSIICVAFLSVMIPLIITSLSHDEWDPIRMLIFRFIGNGDAFPIFYASQSTSGIINEHTGIIEYIAANMSGFKIDFGYVTSHNPMEELGNVYVGIGQDYIAPLIRHNIIGIKLFGVEFAFLYSLIIGLLIGFVSRYVLRKIKGLNYITYIIYADLYLGLVHCTSNYIVSNYFDPVIIDTIFIYIFYKANTIIKNKI